MAKGPFDDTKIDITCPACGKKTKQSLGRLKGDPTLTCPSCGAAFDVKGSAGVDQIDKAVDGLRKALSKFGKRR